MRFAPIADDREALYERGLPDAEIARRVGAKANTITVWRRKSGLPPNVPMPTKEDHAKRMLLYQLGWSDYRISREVEIDRSAILRWRVRRRLKANHAPQTSNERSVPSIRDLHDRVRRAVGRALPRDIIDDTVSDLCLALLDGTLSITEIERQARRYGNRTLDRFASKFGPRSLDASIGDDDFTLMDTLVDSSSSDWLEEMGATVW